ncbi:9284_t:CDS:10 [Dentiscutata erythropus]|uniref:9284_t:CDS:1 n=1 Tax=Dentiscutata erythropus TaxID=1348616 RepID=A0A9N9C9M6_9GLOM|nr:9284_t:CDS:10 [Dentiscutata erythropus]
MNFDAEDTCCVGCQHLIEEGNVIAFGEGIWHVECFRCAKCLNQIEHDSNILLLSDGNPICQNCSYNCNVCKKPILDEAIMTGDESFHVECFRCRQCRSKIDDLVFAKTNQGIYCMKCHSDRVNKAKQVKETKEKTNIILPQSLLDKSLPSLPAEASVDNIQKSHSLEDTGNRRHSRLFDNQLASKVLDQFTGKPNGHQKSREDLPKKHGGIFSKKNDSIDNLSRMLPSKNRGETNEKHSRNASNASITSSRSEPYDGSGHTFSLNSNHSDKMELWSRGMHRKVGSSSSIKKRTLQNQQQLPYIDEQQSNSQPNEYPSYSSYYPSRSNSPSTPSSNSPTSPDFPSSTNNDVTPRKGAYDSGPPVLPPLPFSDRISSFSDKISFSDKSDDGNTDDTKFERSILTGDFSDEKSFKSQNGSVKTESIGDNSPGESPMSPERKDSLSSLTSASSKENEIIIIEPEDAPAEELKRQLIEAKKKLRVSQKAFDEFRMAKEDFDNEVALRRKAEEAVESLRAELELQHKTLEAARLDREHFEKLLNDAKFSTGQLQSLQSELKELNLQKEIIINELEVLAKEKQAGLAENTSVVSNHNLTGGSFAKHLSTQFDLVKQNYLSDIKSLQSEKDSLLQETEELRSKRDQHIEEVKHLNAKNMELAEMNNELTRQIEMHSKGKVANKIFKINKSSGGYDAVKQSPYNDPECTDATPIVSVRNVDHRNSVAQPRMFKWIAKKGKKFLASTNISLPVYNNDNREDAKQKMIDQMLRNQDNANYQGMPIVNEYENSMFGLDLTKQAELDGDEVPYIVLKCILAVELRGMDLEGIYRKAGAATQVREIITSFDQGKDLDLETPHQFNDISAVTSVLKQYLRELPDPLLTYELYPSFLEAIALEDGEEKLEIFRQLTQKMPKVHYSTTRHLMLHLDRVRQQGADNRMTAKNLAVVFGPTLLRGPNPNSELLDMASKNRIIEYIIENVNTLFPAASNHVERRKDGFI